MMAASNYSDPVDHQPSSNKAGLRRQWLEERRALSSAQWQRQSQQICHQLRQCPTYRQAKTVLTYSSFRQEPDLRYLFEDVQLDDVQKQWGVPRCVGKHLIWHQFTPGVDYLQSGAFGILEPSPMAPQMSAAQVDLILVPCVGGDRRGYRLGYGGGFYDRLFADPVWSTIPTIGIVFDVTYVEKLPTDPWDRPLDMFCTEMGWFGACA